MKAKTLQVHFINVNKKKSLYEEALKISFIVYDMGCLIWPAAYWNGAKTGTGRTIIPPVRQKG